MKKSEFDKLYNQLYVETLTEYRNSGRIQEELSKVSDSEGNVSNKIVSATILTESVYLSSVLVKKVLESVLEFDD